VVAGRLQRGSENLQDQSFPARSFFDVFIDISLPTIDGNNNAIVGFTGGTGALNSTQVISNFSFGPAAAPEPSTLTLLGIGIASIVGYGWRRRKPAAA